MKKISLLIVVTYLILSACTSRKFKQLMMDELNTTEEYLPKDFLVGEWKIDSIVGDSELIEEWAYFTDDSKFWRFSFARRSYIVENDLDFKYNFIRNKANDIAYRISKVDTNHIVIKDSTHTKFHLTRWMYSSDDVLNTYIIGDSIKQKLMGSWKLDSSTTKPVTFPTSLLRNFCNDVRKGSRLVFAEDGEAIVYNSATNHTPCKQYFYKVFRGYIGMEDRKSVV